MTAVEAAVEEPGAGTPTLADLLDLVEVDRDRYRAMTVFDDADALYGGQVAAQALVAAGHTVEPGRLPHSLHGYYLRGGDTARPTTFEVARDRDGRSYSARRVVALQGGEMIFTLAASFHVEEQGVSREALPTPDAGDPEDLPPGSVDRLFSMDVRRPPQPYPDVRWPTRIWTRCTADLGDDPLRHAAALTYLSDIFSGLTPLAHTDGHPGPSLDHAVWFHRPTRMDDWVLMDLVPQAVAGGRGFYRGTIHDRAGELVASIAQESLFRRARG
jgi:acyl-CoA thioesterase-2